VDQILKAPRIPQQKKESQMARVINETRVNIAIMNNKAYWIRNNTVFSSKLDEEGNVDIENAEKVDVFSLSEKEMKSLMSIIDSLNK
jgi:GTP-binding protein EngB required for normal cell division